MFEKITPEQAGIKSENILNMLKALERKNYSMHSMIMTHNGKIFFEQHWAPYNENSLHRLYSASKSFVSLAIGFLYDEGKIELGDKIIRYFPEYTEKASEYIKEQTVRDMLKMSTASLDRHWMALGIKNRTEYYFTRKQNRPSGTLYNYDSTGTYILGILVEKISGKNFIDYLKEKLFRKIGVSEELYCLKTPEGHLWADSGVLCRSIDFLKIAQFATNMGMWNGEQLLSREYMIAATSMQAFTANDGYGGYNKYGYGYQFWITEQNGFSFNGMANQFAICIPEKNFVFICTADNQFNPTSAEIIFENVFEKIVEPMSVCEIKENQEKFRQLKEYSKSLKLAYVKGETHSEFEKRINGVTYVLDENDMKISEITLHFDEERRGRLVYVKDDGVRELSFGMGENIFSVFPEESMPDEIGGEVKQGYSHKCAVSAAWVESQKIFIKVQIIDKYLANMNITIGFNEGNVGLQIVPNAEFFLEKYRGFASGKIK